MELQSAQELKSRLLKDVVVPFTRAATARATGGRRRAPSGSAFALAKELAAASPLAVSATPGDTLPDVQRSVALGIARKGKQYLLAVRVQRPALMTSPLVEHLREEARSEVDVRMVGRIEKRQSGGSGGRMRVRPLAIGTSIGHLSVTAGTLGAFVSTGPQTFILSNNHVLANENAAKAGDRIVQPGVLDGGKNPTDAVARLGKFVALRLTRANFVDAAIAQVLPGIEIDPSTIRGLVGGANRTLAGLGADWLDEGTAVFKLGRTTGATEGRVTAFDMDNVVVAYTMGNLRFDNQVEIEGVGNAPFSDGGDSGSVIVDDASRAVALLFAGGDTGGSNGLGLTYANPIGRVLADLKVTLLF
jgi:hypothetical protein